jgi:hypothetical protein
VGQFQIRRRTRRFPAKAQRRKESIQANESLNTFAPLRLCGKFFCADDFNQNFKLSHYQISLLKMNAGIPVILSKLSL